MMTGCPHLISVITPCFNAEKYLHEAIESVMGQTYTNIELIVVDDGSTDNSIDIAKSFGDSVILLKQDNKGPYPARNRGLRASNGKFIAFLDADDYWRADCLEKLHAALCNSDAVLAYCGWQNIGIEGGGGKPYIPPDYESGNKVELFLQHAAPWPIHAALIRRSALEEVGGFSERLFSCWPIHAALIRRSALEEVGGFSERLFSCMDYDLWLRIASSQNIKRVNEALAFYRHHSKSQITSKKWEQARNVWSIKRNFIKQYPELVADTLPSTLKNLIDGELHHRAYEAFWKRDLVSARRIFRMLLRTGYWELKDLKYIIPALLPESMYIDLIKKIDVHSNLRANVQR
jgi:glycosyltransferase involved in cell wall biosynthesis